MSASTKSPIARLRGAPWMVLFLWAFQLGLGLMLGMFVAKVTAAAMAGNHWVDDGHLLGALAELTADHPTVLGAFLLSMMGSAIVGGVFWVLAAGGVYSRLAERTRGAESFAASARWSLPVLVQTLYGTIVRVLLVGLFAKAAGASDSGFGLLSLALANGLAVLAIDHARAAVILEDARRWHPGTYLQGFVAAIKQWKLLLGGSALLAAQVGVSMSLVVLALRDPWGSGTIWVLRLMALIPLTLGLLRVAYVVRAHEHA